MVVLTTSPMRAARIQNDNSPLSDITIGWSASSDFTNSTSFSKNFLSTHGQSPNLNNGSFSTCHLAKAGASLYLATRASKSSRISCCCSSFGSPFAHSGRWHSGHRMVFIPTTNKTSAFLFAASATCQSTFSKANSSLWGSRLFQSSDTFRRFTCNSSKRAVYTACQFKPRIVAWFAEKFTPHVMVLASCVPPTNKYAAPTASKRSIPMPKTFKNFFMQPVKLILPTRLQKEEVQKEQGRPQDFAGKLRFPL